jgi:hypothetical protein
MKRSEVTSHSPKVVGGGFSESVPSELDTFSNPGMKGNAVHIIHRAVLLQPSNLMGSNNRINHAPATRRKKGMNVDLNACKLAIPGSFHYLSSSVGNADPL